MASGTYLRSIQRDTVRRGTEKYNETAQTAPLYLYTEATQSARSAGVVTAHFIYLAEARDLGKLDALRARPSVAIEASLATGGWVGRCLC